MSRRWRPLVASAILLAAAAVFVALLASSPADCGRVGAAADDWTARGVVVKAPADCPLHSGDLVTALDGRPLAGAPGTSDAADPDATAPVLGEVVELDVERDGRTRTVPVTLARPEVGPALAAAWPTLLFVVSLLAVAAYVTWRRPGAPTTALLAFATGLGASSVAAVLWLPVVDVPGGPGRWLYLALTQAVYLTGWAGGLAFALIFPRPFDWFAARNRLTRSAIVTAPLWVTAGWAAAAAPGSANDLDWIGRVIGGGALVVIASLLTTTALGLSRLRGSRDPLERQQVRWLVGTGTLAVAAGLAGWFLPEVLLGTGLPTGWIGLAALPFVVGLGVAVTRYRLFDLDLVLNRGLVYGLLTASLVSVYLLVVTLAAGLMRGETTTPAAIVATVVVALAVNPLRVALQRGVGRVLYGDRDDPYSALSRLGRRFDLAGGVDLLPAVAEDVADALRVPYVVIEVRRLDRRVVAGTRPRWLADDTDLAELPLVDRGERIGRLLLAPRAPGAPFSRADRRLLEDLARGVGAAVRELGLRADLQHSRERLVLAREEERRRLRRALHDELGPAIAGLGLRTEAARRLVRTDPTGASDVLTSVREGTQELVSDVRRLAYDLRPPALDDLGLAGALRQHAGTVDGPPVTVSAAADLGALPAAVETAAYRIAVEAVANTVRHADARTCFVELTRLDGALQVTVTDDGSGPPSDVRAGVGLTAMRERAAELGGTLRVAGGAEGGTTVVATLPLGREAG
ncbi:MAG TPA: histidine kinase [Jiangellales bacterium]|nr:histidine kinase [Jiangellales bacterium]